MKQVLCLLVACALSSFAISQYKSMDKEQIDSKFGFRDIRLESPFSIFSNKQLVKVEDEPMKKYYKSKIENLKIGDYSLKEITYIFYHDTLVTILLQTKGLINSNGILKILSETYGQGYQSNQYIERYLWIGDKAMIYYDQNSVTNDAIVTISSNEFDLKMRDEESDRNKKAGKSDF
jgi:hypothetical protein